jgi:hypothetical protein
MPAAIKGITAGECGAEHLMEALHGKGNIIALPGVLDSTVSQEQGSTLTIAIITATKQEAQAGAEREMQRRQRTSCGIQVVDCQIPLWIYHIAKVLTRAKLAEVRR